MIIMVFFRDDIPRYSIVARAKRYFISPRYFVSLRFDPVSPYKYDPTYDYIFLRKKHSQFRVSNVLHNLRVTRSYTDANAYETERIKRLSWHLQKRTILRFSSLPFARWEERTRREIFTRVADRKQTDNIIRMTSIRGGRKCRQRMTAFRRCAQFCLFRFVCPTTRYLQFPDPISSLILISNVRLKWYRDIEHRRYNCNV